MKNTAPLLSVIMGIYNTKNKSEVTKSLDSIKYQTFKDWECIICDDGSTDDTYQFLSDYIKNDERFILIRNNQNQGLASSLNNAIKVCRGKYLVRQDVDDYSCSNRFEILVSAVKTKENFDVLGSGMYLFDDDGMWGEYKLRTLEAKKEDFLIGTVVAHPSVIMKKNSVIECGGYRISKETKRCEDYDLFMRMFAKGYKIGNIESKLYYYKTSRNGIKRNFSNVINECIVRKKGFKLLGLGAKSFLYILKPIIVYFIPKKILKKMK